MKRLLSLIALSSCARAEYPIASLVTLDAYVDGFNGGPGACSLDGSPYEIWYSPAPAGGDPERFVIDIMGGAWCGDLASCAARAWTPGNCFLGSSNASCFNADGERCANKTASMSFSCLPACNGARWCGGLLNGDDARNPLTAGWAKVLLPYHDGQSFAGERVDPVMTTFNGAQVPLYFRGHRNFLAAMDWLMKNAGMAAAKEVALTGNSAGGLATYWHADELSALLPGARVWASPDSGYFYADDAAYPAWRAELLALVAMANATGGLDASCVAAQRAAGLSPAECAFPEVVTPYITTPLFVMNSRFDPALDSIAAGENGHNATHVNAIGSHVLDLISKTALSPGSPHAAFVTACAEHCGQWAQGSDGDFNVTVDGYQAIPALATWRDGGSRKLWLQTATFPCATCCAGGPSPIV